MKCPHCRSTDTEVFNSRSTKFDTQIWRRRRCLACQQSFTTYEAADLSFLKVTKKSGKPERYSRAKLFGSIYGAFSEIAGKQDAIDAVTATVEAKILEAATPAVASRLISELTLQTLRHYSTAAFVRYLARQTDLASEAQLRKELKKY
jgi:transcriptional repressor NrdR